MDNSNFVSGRGVPAGLEFGKSLWVRNCEARPEASLDQRCARRAASPPAACKRRNSGVSTARFRRCARLPADLLMLLFIFALLWVHAGEAESHATWRAATSSELQAVLPERAPVVRERIETEMRSASGITDGHGHYVAGVVLITAGYSAYGKYTHFFLTQVPLRIGSFTLQPGSYLIGWKRRVKGPEELDVGFYDSASGVLIGAVPARLDPAIHRVESIRIWPPADRGLIQIGRFVFPYRIGE